MELDGGGFMPVDKKVSGRSMSPQNMTDLVIDPQQESELNQRNQLRAQFPIKKLSSSSIFGGDDNHM
jgi:hypothetical protein